MKRNLEIVARTQRVVRPADKHEVELELYRRIFHSANDAIAIIDSNGYYLEQNAAHQRLTGYSDAELKGQTPAIHFGHEVFSRVTQELARNGTFHGELTSRSKQGEERIVELSAFTMQDGDGNVFCSVGMKRDVSERKRADAEPQARLQQQAVVARLGQQALSGQDLDELMRDAVTSAAQVLASEYGKLLELLPSREQFLLRAGAGWKDGLVGKTTVEASRNSHAGYTLHSSSPVVVEDLAAETRFHGASLLWDHHVLSGVSVLVPGSSGPWGVLTVHSTHPRKYSTHDINFLVSVANVLAATIEGREAEKALRESENRFRRVQQSAGIGAYEWDLRSDRIYWSEPLPSLHFLSSGSLDSWFKYVDPQDRERVQQIAERVLREGSEFEIQTRLLNEQGEVFWVVTRGQVFRENGRPVHVAGIVLDITAHKQTEELLQRSEKLATVGRLAASITHEINNPLESVTNLLYLIENQPGLDATTRGYAQLASQELSRVSHISRQTLAFYRGSSHPTTMNLAELLDDVIRMYARKLEAKRITVLRDYCPDSEVQLYPNEIRQVFSNLLMNALEASDVGCTITVRLKKAVAWGRPEVRGFRLVVADQGHGIEKRNHREVFEPFFTTKGEKGTGLGLWVCNGLVQKHGGSIRMRSSTHPQRHGTVFAVFLPSSETELTATSGAQAEAATEA